MSFKFFKTKLADIDTILISDGSKNVYEYGNISTYSNEFTLSSQYYDFTKADKQFVLTGIVVEAKGLSGTLGEYEIVVTFDGTDIVTISKSTIGADTYITRHPTGNLPITGLKYILTGTYVQINNIKVEGYYLEA